MEFPPPPPPPLRPFDLLCRRAGGRARAIASLQAVSSQLGLPLQRGLTGVVPDQVLAAVALIGKGMSPDSVSGSLTWREFEGFCADLLGAYGYGVRTNIVLTKPRRQIDIFADSETLALSVDCKHWGRPTSRSSLEIVASNQIERTALYKRRMSVRKPILPMILTLVDTRMRGVLGVPVVPVAALRDFLSTVSRFDEGLATV